MGALLRFLKQAGFYDRACSLSSYRLQQFKLSARVGCGSIAAADAERADGFRSRIEGYAHPCKDVFQYWRETACLAFPEVILCDDRTAFADDLRGEPCAG